MARKLAVAYKRGELIRISPTNLDVDYEFNGRTFDYQFSDLVDILNDLQAGRDINTPLLARPIQKEDGQHLSLVAGFRRFLCAQIWVEGHKANEFFPNGIDPHPDYLLDVKLVEPKEERDAVVMNITENAKRKLLTIVDVGNGAIRLRDIPTTDGGYTLQQIAEVFHVSQAQITQAIKLVTELPEQQQKLIASGAVTVDNAFLALKINDPNKRQEFIANYLSGGSGPILPPKESAGSSTPASPAPAPATPAEAEGERPSPRQAARDAGANLSRKMPEFKKYLQEAIDEDGPGSNKGEVMLKKEILKFLEGRLTNKQMDNRFGDNCKSGGGK